ncbi:hypothetical protein PV325_004151 [Microctonus aethiopoides]|nr:hypothetical protein PV325_004151 [Microctonus aethiopoides]
MKRFSYPEITYSPHQDMMNKLWFLLVHLQLLLTNLKVNEVYSNHGLTYQVHSIRVPVNKFVSIEVEKFVPVPVEKIVQIPVDRIVRVPVDGIVRVPPIAQSMTSPMVLPMTAARPISNNSTVGISFILNSYRSQRLSQRNNQGLTTYINGLSDVAPEPIQGNSLFSDVALSDYDL